MILKKNTKNEHKIFFFLQYLASMILKQAILNYYSNNQLQWFLNKRFLT